jgi:N-acyl-D-amino-acid deacylase
VVGLDEPDRADTRRGLLRTGWAADLVAFDPASVQDRAAYDDPHQLAHGMSAVWVGGEPAWREGDPVGEHGRGRAIRRR